MGNFYLRRRTPRSQYQKQTDYSADVIKNYFRAVASHFRSHGRTAAIAEARNRMSVVEQNRRNFAMEPGSQGSNMSFSQGAVSSLTAGSGSASTGTIYTGTPSANRAATHARRILRGVRASCTRPTAMKAAMFLPGKGAEVDLIANNYLQPIIHKINWKAPKLRYDGVTSGLENPKGNRVSMDFAFKMILECQKAGMNEPTAANAIIPTRFSCAHFFRHTNGNANASSGTTPAMGGNTLKWHGSLGPDASYIRLLPAAGGTLQGTFPSAYGNTNLSPYRYPTQGQAMYTRMSLQTLENIGWNLNPLKLTGILDPSAGSVLAFPNAVDAGTSGVIAQSSANTQMVSSVSPGVSANKYITQHGPGGVRYNFSNDGTNAVTIECVIVGFKNNAVEPTGAGYGLTLPYKTFQKTATAAYFMRQDVKKGIQDLGGDEHDSVPNTGTDLNASSAIFSNAETDFVPNNIWPFMGKGTSGTTNTDTVLQPFKYISRDQFILGGGQSRIWKTSFPSDVYDASTDSPQLQENVNSHSFMIIWSVCSAPTPVLQTSANAASNIAFGKIQLSREAQNCNVSCVGTYHETPTPVFAKVNPTPVNLVGSLDQVTILPYSSSPAANQWPVGSYPRGAHTVPTYNEALGPDGTTKTQGLMYVDLPRSGQQPFLEPTAAGNATQVADVLPIGTLSTTQ